LANRFTDSRKWDDPWFRKLPCKYKTFWLFILDKCNHAGIWKIDIESASFHIGENIDCIEAYEIFGNRIHKFKDSWFISKFIKFQYGVLSENNRVHGSVLKILEEEGLSKVYGRALKGLKDYDYVKDKEKDKQDISNDISKDILIMSTFKFFCKITGQELNSTKDRLDLIEKRFKDGFTEKQIKSAIINFSQDEWEDRKKYYDLRYCIGTLKGIDNLEKWFNVNTEASEPHVYTQEEMRSIH